MFDFDMAKPVTNLHIFLSVYQSFHLLYFVNILFTIFKHLHLIVAEPVGVFIVVDSIPVVIEVVNVRDPIVVVVHILCNVIWMN